jgi:serine protease Do
MRKLIKTLCLLTVCTLTLGFGYKAHVDQVNDAAIKAARETTIRSNIGKYIVAPHVVKIIVAENGEAIGSATGFYLTYLGKVRIVTNKHVCDQSEGKREMIIHGIRFPILHISKTQDLCIIKSDRDTGLDLAAHDVGPQDKVILVGHPRGLALTIREGFVMESGSTFFSWIGEDGRTVDYTMVSTIAYPGNSGSPVTNENGEVIGVLFAGDMSYITEGMIVPYHTLIKYLQSTYKL